MSIRFQLKIIFPQTEKKKSIDLEAFVFSDHSLIDLAGLAFNIEQTLNNHMPQIRVHANIEVIND